MGSTTFPYVGDQVIGFQIADKDDDATPNYYGYTRADGAWYIMKEEVSPGADTYRFARGSSNYPANWTGRAALTYDYFHITF